MSDQSHGDVIITGIRQKLALLDRQVALGLEKQALLDHQTVVIIGNIQNGPPLTDADATKLSAEISNGPWSAANKVAIGNTILESSNSDGRGTKKARRDNQKCDNFHLFLTDSDWQILMSQEWGEVVKQQTIAMRLNAIGITCTNIDLYKRAAALAMRSTYDMDNPAHNSAVLKQKAAFAIKGL
eukprot:7451288-Pyramimonas_sp.AAC.1